ncbi:hypothetical protein I0C86_08175 [Plantactinospora sp. S1510]|uniref:Uncharacterized protein n=1 Tax=Plantactinospora alkalitolerans TaxID=2789879 RepID=A0ABS0GRZ0_9ACTN|nr:hypothetical protein [Plantactinospora alkalitolerans]MBF9128960.1 hypothetical protein [Plantactinospora alkalitolerans]
MTHSESEPSVGGEQEPRLEARMAGISRRTGAIELAVELSNPSPDRAVHYISDLRAIVFDDATGRFLVRLTDEGRELIPSTTGALPRFAQVDPASTAVLSLRLPEEIVRMRVPEIPTAEVELERHELGPDAEIEVVIGWSDTPFYPDTRGRRSSAPSSAVEWEKGQARLVIPGGEGG